MLGDILLINDMHKDAAQSIYEKVTEARAKLEDRYRFVVGISGESGSGKSELAHALGKLLKEHHVRVKVIHTDNYYKIQPLLREEWRRGVRLDKDPKDHQGFQGGAGMHDPVHRSDPGTGG
jgi:uridine kinase